METFGVTGGMRRGGRGRGRGRGGYRGGRGGSRYQGREDSGRSGRGGWRGGRGGSRGGRQKAWVDYPINGDDDRVPRNIPNGPSVVRYKNLFSFFVSQGTFVCDQTEKMIRIHNKPCPSLHPYTLTNESYTYSGYQSHAPSNDFFPFRKLHFGGRQSNVSMTITASRVS